MTSVAMQRTSQGGRQQQRRGTTRRDATRPPTIAQANVEQEPTPVANMMRRTPDAEDARDWARRWQNEVDEERRATRKQMGDIATALESVVTRLEALEERPKEGRAILGVASNTIYTLVAIVALGFDALTTVLALGSAVVALIALFR